MTAYLADISVRPKTLLEYRRHLNKAPDIPLSKLNRLSVDLSTPHAITAWKAFGSWCEANELIARNPFQKIKAKFNQRDRVLTDEELRAIWHYNDPPFSHIVKLLILTGQRRSEIASIQPYWIKGNTITFPATHTKNKHTHTLPFGDLTKQYLVYAPFSFNGWGKSKKRMDKQTRVTAYTLHDLRRTYATIMAQLGTPVVVTEKLLNHISGTTSGIVGIYQKHQYLAEMNEAVHRYELYLQEKVVN